jgi:hypothetical protein
MSSSIPVPAGSPPATPAAPPARPKRSLPRRILRRTARFLMWTALTAVLIGAIAAVWILWFFPNGIAASTATSLAKDYGISLTIGKLDVRPLHGATVEGLAIDVPSNRALPPLLSVGKVDVGWSLPEAFHKTLHVTHVVVDDPHLHLELQGKKWNWERAMDDLMPPPAAATPTPAPTGTLLPLEQQLAQQSQSIDAMLSQLPVALKVDALEVHGAGADVVTGAGTIATVSGIATTVALDLPRGGGGTISVAVHPEPGIDIAVQPSGDLGFSGRLRPDVAVAMDLPKKVTFTSKTSLEDALVVAGGMQLPLAIATRAHGEVDVPEGDLVATLEDLDVGGFFDAAGALDIRALGTKSIHADWKTKITGDKLPEKVSGSVKSGLSATTLHPGGRIDGHLDAKLDSSDPGTLAATFAKGRFPLVLTLESDGASEPDPIAAMGVHVGGVTHHAKVTVSHTELALETDAQVTKLSSKQLLEGTPISIRLSDKMRLPASLDALDIDGATVAIPEIGLALAGHGRLGGLTGAWKGWQDQTSKSPDTMKAGLAALTALSEIRLAGSFDFDAKKELAVTTGAYVKGAVHAKGELTRGKDPYGRVKADVVYDDFSARVADLPVSGPKPALVASNVPVATPSASPTPKPDLLLLQGMNAHLVLDREIILGGHPAIEAADIAADEQAVFDPATRGYYDRLGSLRAEADNVRIDRVEAGPLKITDLSAEVLYDGTAVHVNRGRMQLLGGEVVGRMILRPTSQGVHFTTAADCSGIDMSPLLLEHPVADPNDTRIHMSSTASFFLSKDDPIGSLAAAKARVDITAAGNKVLDTLLAWLDPENKDPMYNWARTVDSKITGISRPVLSSNADRGMYDVTISFPSLGVSKDVKRIPLAPLLRLKYTQEMLGAWAPPGEMLPLLSARGIDADGNFLLPPVPKEDE